ncbi:chromosome segregation protein SMC [Lactococcus sp.]|uniref:chromosome segregation protein SMC n=1 Tax=Lactococcus sp. TaxID=44273 RepID=UPI0035AFE5C3
MYLNKMEIVGFKSFADRTKIAFDQGVTAIVGPNGSGKSNIVEALRWVLGEQSAKSLRGGKMPDVIFSGTEKRNAMNYAEVIASFDNRDGYLPNRDEDQEVIISRRLYRNGDSEFRINGKKCRLRDIHDLFLDTGLGRDSLSIISQGRIESVFNSKPEERRAIFEEAAGVLKYKSRKHETESKLSSTQDNLDRLEDIIFELNGQLVPLQAQKDVALRFKTLDATRFDLALAVLIGQLKKEKAKLEATKTSLLTANQALEALSSQQKQYDDELLTLRNKRNQVELEQEKIRQEALSLTELKADLTRKIELFDVQKNSSKESAKEREARLSELNTKLLNLSAQQKEATEKLSVLTAEKMTLDTKVSELTSQVDRLSEAPEVTMERLREAFVDLVNQEAQKSNVRTKNQAEIDNLLEKMAARDESTKENTAQLLSVSESLRSLKTTYDAVKSEILELVQHFESQTAAIKKLQEAERLAQNEMYDQMNQLNKDKARLSSLENIRDSHSNLYQGVRAVMQNQAQFSGIIGVVADLLTFDTKYTTAIDIALGGGSQNIITGDENAAKAAINFLRDRRLGRATFLPLTTIKGRQFQAYDRISSLPGFIDTAVNLVSFDEKLRPAISSLLGATVIVDTAEHATAIARSMNYTVRIVTLDGTQINPGGSYSGGAGKRNSTTFTQAEIESLQKLIQAAEEKLKQAEKAVQAVQLKKEALTRTLEDLKAQGEEKRFDEKSLLLKIEQLEESKSNLTALSALTESAQVQTSLNNLQASNESLSAELEKIGQEKRAIEQQLEDVKSNSQAQNEQKTQLLENLNQAKLKVSELTSELRFVSTDENRLSAEIKQLNEEKSRLLDLLAPELDFDDATRQQFASQLQEVSQKLQALNVKSVSLKFEREDLVAQMEDLEQHNHDFIEQSHTLNLQKTRLELQIEQMEQVLFDKQNELNTEYEMSFEEGVNKARVLEDLETAELELKQVQRQIRALGPVNLDAIAQFEEVNERYQFLNGQKQDLQEAKNLLLSTIDDMNEEVIVRFKTTFDAIRESFKTTFSQMFVGGKADLELTSDNLLEAGVEINVQPPGKKLSSLNLMSGGEKALTALALIFAILRVRTVPFVVLDEVEAALDEANVQRFGDYMNHFDNSNQFIVVTHRRGTMAAAGAMYGVTMADAGVSKMMSVKLSE